MSKKDDLVEPLRRRIDFLDEEIALLMIRRRQTSQSIQRAKLLQGMPSVDIAREQQVIAHYRLWLGPDSDHFAHEILNFSKKAQVH